MGYDGCECYWAKPTGLARHSLRRYSRDDFTCTATLFDYHNASVDLPGEHPLIRNEHGWAGDFDADRGDPSWPARCACGYEFTVDDHWQGNAARLYQRATGELIQLTGVDGDGGRGPAGMLTHGEHWHPGGPWEDRYGDGINLVAVCPNGAIWHVDGPAWNNGKATPNAWTRAGDPRTPGLLVVSPSIVAGDYHGWVGQNGADPGHFSPG